MRALTLGIVLAVGLAGCGSKGMYCVTNTTTDGILDGCTCVADSHFPNDTTCGPATDTESICCAAPTWPDADTCSCKAFYCAIDATQTCRCSALPPTSEQTRVDNCTGTHCCLVANDARTDYECTCRDEPCAEPAVEIADCSPAGIATATWCGLLEPYSLPDAVVVASCR
jgi:hypothetical protein